jgi:hypothetical protein
LAAFNDQELSMAMPITTLLTALEQPIGMAWLAMAMVVCVVLIVLLYRIILHGMRTGRELQLGKWFYWKK